MKKLVKMGMVMVGFIFLCVLLFLLVGLLRMAVAETIVIVGGWGSSKEPEQLEYFQKNIPGSIAIAPNRLWPLSSAAQDVLRQLKERGVDGELVLIAHSWGGLIAREIDAENPGLVKKIITIGTPNNGFWFAPWFVSEVRNAETPAPLYAVAGDVGHSGTDGVVSVFSALGAKKVKDARIFSLGHVELMQSKEVLNQVFAWLKNK